MSTENARTAKLQALVQEREQHIRESWVRSMEVRIVRDELQKCQRAEGVNHYESCKELSDRYIDMLKQNRTKGWKQIDL